MDLFEYMKENNLKKEAPLASRMRPKTLDEIVGQKHILGEGKLLYRAIKADKLSSVIFYGPPGTGKTTLAKVIANTTQGYFVPINATSAGKKDMEVVVKQAEENRGMYCKKTILFVDEIHRFNKAQQDYLLPYVEEGTLILIGATTENPYFEVNSALLSRSTIFELYNLETPDLLALVKRCIEDCENGLGHFEAEITKEAAEFIAENANGDARAAVNAIELAVLTTQPKESGKILIDLETASQCIQKPIVTYDKNGDNHYDIISAFIKSMRGSDPDAVVYYLARMLNAGEDIKFIARRIMICASEDVGNADPNALVLAVNASLAVERVGMPEARILLSQAAVYVAMAPKSNASYMAINQALDLVSKGRQPQVPNHLRDGSYYGAKKLERGIGYQYAHSFPDHYVKQQYLPVELEGRKFYEPTDSGVEGKYKKYWSEIKGRNYE